MGADPPPTTTTNATFTNNNNPSSSSSSTSSSSNIPHPNPNPTPTSTKPAPQKRSRAPPTADSQTQFLYLILKQLDLKSVNWQEVADGIGIKNGHAARMRWSRFKSQTEGLPTQSQRKALAAAEKREKEKEKKNGGNGIGNGNKVKEGYEVSSKRGFEGMMGMGMGMTGSMGMSMMEAAMVDEGCVGSAGGAKRVKLEHGGGGGGGGYGVPPPGWPAPYGHPQMMMGQQQMAGYMGPPPPPLCQSVKSEPGVSVKAEPGCDALQYQQGVASAPYPWGPPPPQMVQMPNAPVGSFDGYGTGFGRPASADPDDLPIRQTQINNTASYSRSDPQATASTPIRASSPIAVVQAAESTVQQSTPVPASNHNHDTPVLAIESASPAIKTTSENTPLSAIPPYAGDDRNEARSTDIEMSNTEVLQQQTPVNTSAGSSTDISDRALQNGQYQQTSPSSTSPPTQTAACPPATTSVSTASVSTAQSLVQPSNIQAPVSHTQPAPIQQPQPSFQIPITPPASPSVQQHPPSTVTPTTQSWPTSTPQQPNQNNAFSNNPGHHPQYQQPWYNYPPVNFQPEAQSFAPNPVDMFPPYPLPHGMFEPNWNVGTGMGGGMNWMGSGMPTFYPGMQTPPPPLPNNANNMGMMWPGWQQQQQPSSPMAPEFHSGVMKSAFTGVGGNTGNAVVASGSMGHVPRQQQQQQQQAVVITTSAPASAAGEGYESFTAQLEGDLKQSQLDDGCEVRDVEMEGVCNGGADGRDVATIVVHTVPVEVGVASPVMNSATGSGTVAEEVARNAGRVARAVGMTGVASDGNCIMKDQEKSQHTVQSDTDKIVLPSK